LIADQGGNVGARTGEQYLKGLRATNREIWIGNERVSDVADHPQFTQAAHAVASWYDLQFEHPDELLIPDPETGEQINVSHMIPRSADDLRRRGVGLARISELSMGVMGRLPDYMNVTFAGFAGNPTDWRGPNGENEEGSANMVAWQKRLRRNDLSCTHTIVHPTVDKVLDKNFVDNPVPLHKVGETKNSIIVRGARVIATLAPFADEQTVYPSHPLPPGSSPAYALSFTVAMDTPGLVFLCRDSGSRPNTDPFDAPFSSRFDEQDAFCIFDDVEIPKQNVWIDGHLDVYNSVMGTSWWGNIMQQTSIRALTKLEFAHGLAARMAETVNDVSPHAQELLGELAGFIEITRNSIIAAETTCITFPDGGVFTNGRSFHPMRSVLADFFVRTNQILRAIGGHNLLAVASRGQLNDSRLRPLIDEFIPGANGGSSEDRAALYRMAWDFVGSALGARNELYEANYLGSARNNRINLGTPRYGAAYFERGNELVNKMLADTRARRA
jgi:4-hydroxyphenylacetate 3-monooxygenase